MIIAIASGKGGTGKTTVATSLAATISDQPVTFLDCDVEAPNAHLFLRPDIEYEEEVCVMVPEVDRDRCIGCGTCAQVCQYHAIVMLADQPLVLSELCHGCGSCALNCPENAIRETPKSIGFLRKGTVREKFHFANGTLKVSEPLAVPIIRNLVKWASNRNECVEIRDAPPGTSCPVVETIYGVDFVLLVTEPTPFGLHDLQLAHQLTRDLGLPTGVVVNRCGIGDSKVDEFCESEGIPILMRIPMEQRIAALLAKGLILSDTLPDYRKPFKDLYLQIESRIKTFTQNE